MHNTKRIFFTKYLIFIVLAGLLLFAAVFVLLRPNTEKTEITTNKISGDKGRGIVVEGTNVSEKKQYLQTSTSVIYQSEVLASPRPNSNAAVLNWDQQDQAGEVIAGFRLHDGKQWSKWVESTSTEDRKDGAPVPHSALVLGNTIHKIQYRFELIADSQTRLSPEVNLASASIELVDSTKGPSPTEKKTSILGNALQSLGIFKSAAAHSDEPRIFSRAEWGSPEPNSSHNWTPEYRQLHRVIVHHTAVASEGDSAASVRAIWQFHTYNRGWGDIGYNYLVDQAGNIFQGRYFDKEYAESNSVDVVGGHALSYNFGSSGIAALGDFTNSQPTSALLNSIGYVAAYKLYRYEKNPTTWEEGLPVMVGHRDVLQTSCPGTLHNYLPTLRSIAEYEYNHFANRSLGLSENEVIKATNSPTTYLTQNNQLRPIGTAGQKDCFVLANAGRIRSVSPTSLASATIGSPAGACSPPNYTWFYTQSTSQQYVLLYGDMYPIGYGDAVALNRGDKARPLSDAGVEYLENNYVSPQIPGHILIKASGAPEVYEANNDNLKHVRSPDSRDCFISQIGAVRNVPDSLISAYQANGKIISGGATCTVTTGLIGHPQGTSLAHVVNGTRRNVGNPAIRDCIASRNGFGAPYTVSQPVWDSLSSGISAYCPYSSEVRFVKEVSQPTVWRVFSDGRKQHANGFCVPDPLTTPLQKYRVWIVPNGEVAGHAYDGVFSVNPENCQAIT